MSTNESPVELQSEPEGAQPQPDAAETLKTRDLIKANDALKMLQFYVGGRSAAKKLLIDLISDGEIRAYAGGHWTTNKKTIKATWRAGPPEDAIKRKRIKPAVFAGSSVLDEDRKNWDWKRNRFHVTHVKKGGTILRYFYRGVRFERAGIEELLAEAKAVMRDFYKGGRKYEGDRWTEFWVQVVLLARAGKMADPKVGAGTFHNAVYKAYLESGPKEEPLKYDSLAIPLRKVRKAIKAAEEIPVATDQLPTI